MRWCGELADIRLGECLMLYGRANVWVRQGFGAAVAISETIRYSYFLPLALNFILSLSSVNWMPVFTGISS